MRNFIFCIFIICLFTSCANLSNKEVTTNRAPASFFSRCRDLVSRFLNRDTRTNIVFDESEIQAPPHNSSEETLIDTINENTDEPQQVTIKDEQSNNHAHNEGLKNLPTTDEDEQESFDLFFSIEDSKKLYEAYVESGAPGDAIEFPADIVKLDDLPDTAQGDFYETRYFIFSKEGETINYRIKPQPVFNKGKGILKTVKNKSELWHRTEPITYEDGTPLTFSNDSELPYEDSVRMIYSDIAASLKLEEYTSANPISKSAIAEKAGISEKQVDTFALRKDVNKSQEKFQVTDLSPGYVEEHLLPSQKDEFEGFSSIFHIDIERIFRERGFPFKAHNDIGYIELTHESYEVIPSQFFDTINTLKRVTKYSMDHLHLGVPSEKVNEEQFDTIAKIIEALVVVSRCENLGKDAKELDYRTSNFSKGNAIEDWRGMVKAQPNEWSLPHPSHNLEIRHYNGINEGMSFLEYAAFLSLERNELLIIPDFNPVYVRDQKTQSMTQTLRFLAFYLARRDEYKQHAEWFNEFAEMIETLEKKSRNKHAARSEITDAHRIELQKYLKNNRVRNILADRSIFYQ